MAAAPTPGTKLPKPRPEVGELAIIHTVDGLAPAFRAALSRVLFRLDALGWHPVVRETLRTDLRAAYLYGMGRLWDDGRGIVTNARTGAKTWHRYGLAADVADARFDDEHTPEAFWTDLARIAVEEGLTSGADWNRNRLRDDGSCDRPHVQWHCPGMRVTPSAHAWQLLQAAGMAAVWKEVHAE